jgi:serine/threonine-protein kinase HipA
VHEIVRRHFIQSARANGMGESVLTEIFDELKDTADQGLESARNAMPGEFHAPLADSIANGFSARLRLLHRAEAD